MTPEASSILRQLAQLEPGQRRKHIAPLILLAAREAPGFPAAERADLFEAVALVSNGIDSDVAIAAAEAAAAIRDAEARQLSFANLLLTK